MRGNIGCTATELNFIKTNVRGFLQIMKNIRDYTGKMVKYTCARHTGIWGRASAAPLPLNIGTVGKWIVRLRLRQICPCRKGRPIPMGLKS